MPWAWGELTVDEPSDAYHLVWSRDLYQVGTALIAAGDREGAQRALDFLFERQQKADGSFPQNSLVDGTPKWTNLQMDEVALPIVLAWQLRDFGGSTYNQHVKPAANFVAANGPFTRRSAGRTRTVIRRARSRPRSPASWPPPTSPAATAMTLRRAAGWPRPTPGTPSWRTGR